MARTESNTATPGENINAAQRLVRLSPAFARMLRDDPTFRAFLRDAVHVGLLNCRDLFAEARRSGRVLDRGFLIGRQYSLFDIMRLCGWEKENVPLNVGGYFLDKPTGTMPIMVKYATSQYEDEFLGPQEMSWFSKNGQTPDSPVFEWLREGTAAIKGTTANAANASTTAAPANDTGSDASAMNAIAPAFSVPAIARWEDTHFVPLFVMRREESEEGMYYYVGHVAEVQHPTLTSKPTADGSGSTKVTLSTLRLARPLSPELFRYLTGRHAA